MRGTSFPGCHTWGRSLREARRNALDAIVTCAMRDGKDVAAIERDAELVESVELPTRARNHISAAARAREAARRAESNAAAATIAAARALTSAGLSVRDVGELLGLSHQRIQQLKTATPPSRKRVA